MTSLLLIYKLPKCGKNININKYILLQNHWTNYEKVEVLKIRINIGSNRSQGTERLDRSTVVSF